MYTVQTQINVRFSHAKGEGSWIYLENNETSQYTLGKARNNRHVAYVSSENQISFPRKVARPLNLV